MLAAVLAAADLCPTAATQAHIGAALRCLVRVGEWVRVRRLQGALAVFVAHRLVPLRVRVCQLITLMDRELLVQQLHADTLAAPDEAFVRQFHAARSVVVAWQQQGDWCTDLL